MFVYLDGFFFFSIIIQIISALLILPLKGILNLQLRLEMISLFRRRAVCS